MKKRIAWSVVIVFCAIYLLWMVKMMVNTPEVFFIVSSLVAVLILLWWSIITITNN